MSEKSESSGFFLFQKCQNFVWVKFETNNAVKVSTEGCHDVDDYLKVCKKELSPHFDSVATDQLSLTLTEEIFFVRVFLLLRFLKILTKILLSIKFIQNHLLYRQEKRLAWRHSRSKCTITLTILLSKEAASLHILKDD